MATTAAAAKIRPMIQWLLRRKRSARTTSARDQRAAPQHPRPGLTSPADAHLVSPVVELTRASQHGGAAASSVGHRRGTPEPLR